MKKYALVLFIMLQVVMQAQTISGTLKNHKLQEVILHGFDYYNTVELVKTRIDSLGNFNMNLPEDYSGMALLKTEDKKNLVVLIDNDKLSIKGTYITELDSLLFNKGQNKKFFEYALAHGYRRNATNALKYLLKVYQESKNLNKQSELKKVIATEIKRLENLEITYIKKLPEESYLRWFIPYRSFIQDMSIIIRSEDPRRILESITLFRNTDFNHPYWKTSGILREYIEKHYFMLENSRGSLADKYVKMNKSSSHLIDNLKNDIPLLNLISEKLFDLLEKRSLFTASEYLAVKLLTNYPSRLDATLKNKLEKYGTLKVGNIAPNVQLYSTKQLSDYNQPILLVFGVSNCKACKKESLELLKYYNSWKTKKNVEVVYISLDVNRAEYENAYKDVPWQMYCDFKGWETPAANDYSVLATPSYFLLDKNRKILTHINSAAHANAWIMNIL